MKQYKSIAVRKEQLAIFLILAALLAGSLFWRPQQVDAAAKKAKLNYTTVYLCRYHSCTLKVKNTKKAVQWETSDSGVASVDASGIVTGNNPGQCKVTAKFGKKTLVSTVTVTEYEKGEILAGYARIAAEQLLGTKGDITVNSALKGTFWDNNVFGYIEVQYKDRFEETQKAYVYAFAQELPEEGEAYMDTTVYKNLVIRVSSKEIDQIIKTRSSEVQLTRVQEAYSSMKLYEQPEAKKSDTYDQNHTWIGL